METLQNLTRKPNNFFVYLASAKSLFSFNGSGAITDPEMSSKLPINHKFKSHAGCRSKPCRFTTMKFLSCDVCFGLEYSKGSGYSHACPPIRNALGWCTCVQVSLYLHWLVNSHDLFSRVSVIRFSVVSPTRLYSIGIVSSRIPYMALYGRSFSLVCVPLSSTTTFLSPDLDAQPRFH